MKVIVASTNTPFVDGGASLIVGWLASKLRAQGHEVEVLEFPFRFQHEEMLEQMLALRLVDLSQHGDRLIAIRTPAYLLRHPHKVLWFIHHYRGAYDLWYTRYRNIPDTPEGLRHRDAVLCADNVTLREARRIFANSGVVAGRLKKYNGVKSEVLYPPLLAPEDYRCSG
jgi:glycosyltransferase involved in cell wall biosynthesis